MKIASLVLLSLLVLTSCAQNGSTNTGNMKQTSGSQKGSHAGNVMIRPVTY